MSDDLLNLQHDRNGTSVNQPQLQRLHDINNLADSTQNGLLAPQVPRMVNGRPITTIRTVSGGGGGGAGPVGISFGSSSVISGSNVGPGSFNTLLPSRTGTQSTTPIISSSMTTAPSLTPEITAGHLEILMEKLAIERKMKEGAENLLQVLDSKKLKDTKKAKSEAEKALNAANLMIEELTTQVDKLNTRKAQQQAHSPASKLASKFRGEPLLSAHPRNAAQYLVGVIEDPLTSESPTWSLSDLLQSLEEKGRRPEYYVEKANSLVHLLKRHPMLKYDLVWSAFGKRLQYLLCHDGREVVAAGYRIARYSISDYQSLQTIRALNTDYIVINSLAKEHASSDARFNVEREQALKFIRAFLDISNGVKEISRGVLRAIVSCAEQTDDRLRSICIETLSEILILDPSVIIASGGIRVLVQCLADGPYELSDTVVAAFLYLLDMPSTRKHIRAGYDLEIVFSAFTDAHVKSHLHEDKLRSSARVISAMLKSWTGVLSLSMYDLRSIRSFVESLYSPHTIVRDIVLELLFDIFRIKPPSWSTTFLAGRRLTTYGRVTNLKPDTSHVAESKANINLIDHSTALLLAIFLEAKLMDSLLFVVAETTEPAITRKTTLLIGELLKLANRLLPSKISAQLQMLPGLFKSASIFGDEKRFPAAAAVYQIDSLNRTMHRFIPTGPIPQQRLSLDDDKRNQRQVDQVKLKLNLQIDDASFRNLILDSQILTTKNFTKWNWDTLLEIVQGPLLNSKRLEEAIKATKFLKQLMSFFRPFKYRFSAIKNTKPNQKYVRLGCALFTTLLQNSDGIKYLSEDKVLRQVAECLAQLDPMSGITAPDPLFSKARLQDTLNSGYFTFLGVLSRDSNGLAMMDRWRMFNMFYHISELRSRDDLMSLFITSMDFSLEGHPRIILSKALTTGQKAVRLFATNHLRGLVDGCISVANEFSPSTRSIELSEWAIRLLVTQLYDPDVEVCETAIKILEEACASTSSLEYIVKCRPALDHLGEIGAPLLLRFLSTSIGYHYLNELDYINREMDDWFHGRNDAYVDHVEASLARAFADDDRPQKGPDGHVHHITPYVGVVPPHFYKELARSQEGCKLLREKGHFEEFSLFIREHGLEVEDVEIILKVKGCLWAVGNIGSLSSGAAFLEETDTISSIIVIAEQSQVLSLKGTAFFVLGLVSRCVHGLEILDGYGWDSNVSEMGESLGFCLPTNLKQLLSIKPWPYTGLELMSNSARLLPPTKSDDPLVVKIVTSITNLSNHILANEASKELVKLKANNLIHFQSIDMYKRVLSLLETYRYRSPVRRFILELFDKRVLEKLVKESKDAEIDSASGKQPAIFTTEHS